MSTTDTMVGILSAAATIVASNTVEVDPQTIIGGGSVGLLGWLAAGVWRFLGKQTDLQEMQKKVCEAQLNSFADETKHRELERLHWVSVEGSHENAESQLRNIRDEIRERLPTGSHHVVPTHQTDANGLASGG